MKPILEIKNLTVKYNNYVALEKANMIVGETDFIGVIGPNGGGKTTLLKAILGLITPTSGEIVFSDAVNKQKTNIGYLPQVNQFDHRFPIEVIDVVLSGLAGKGNWLKQLATPTVKRHSTYLTNWGWLILRENPLANFRAGKCNVYFWAGHLFRIQN